MGLDGHKEQTLDSMLSFDCRKKARHDSEDQYYIGSKATSLLSSEMEELSGVVYRPRTKETRATYELMLSFIQQNSGDQVCVCLALAFSD